MTESGDEQLRTIDEILAILQSPARAEELDGEDELIEAMAAEVIAAHDQEPAPMHSRSRPLQFGVLVGAAVLSVAGVAAAAGVLPDRRPAPPTAPTIVVEPSASAATAREHVTPISVDAASAVTVPATAADTPTTVATDVAAAAAAAAPTVSAPRCPRDVVNHGDYVSGVARDTPPGPDHGQIVAAAAQSDCGKPTAAAAPEPESGAPTEQGNAAHAASGQGHTKGNNAGGGNNSGGGNNGGGNGGGHGQGHG
jgi:hypothetical protein